MAKRALMIVLDGLGVGELPDASCYGDSGSNTLGNMAKAVGGFKIDNLCAMGLGLIDDVTGLKAVTGPIASYGRMREASKGKDTTTGHFELTGVILDKPFATYPHGFPKEIMDEFASRTGRGWLWGMPASGTVIIERLGKEHLLTGKPIVYTSADSVFQIAAHEEVIPIEELYEICKIARGLLDRHNVGRVIARPFTGRPGSFRRTERRKDFSLEPPSETLLDALKKSGASVVGIGKVPDIFCHRGFTSEVPASGNKEILDNAIREFSALNEGLVLANLVDFDMLYGHRNDAAGYAKALEYFDGRITEMCERMGEEDILIITADHGCDPTTPSTDHSREYVPLLVYGKGVKAGVNLGTRDSFSDVAETLAEFFGIKGFSRGRSFLAEIKA
ncbi:MAG: phosphopentomutase [Thermodesulfobacteriota bacterium]